MRFRYPAAPGDIARIAGWSTLLFAAILLLQSSLLTERIPWQAKALIVGMFALAMVRPADALIGLAVITPFGNLLANRIWRAFPFAFAEALVLAFLAGYLLSERRRFTANTRPSALAVAAWLFAATVVASCAVEWRIVQVWHDFPARYAVSFFRYLAAEYLTVAVDFRPWVDGRGFVAAAALLIEGIALLLCTRALCIGRPELPRRLTIAVVAVGGVVAALTFYSLGVEASQRGMTSGDLIRSARWSPPTIPSLNTAGGYFLLVAVIAFGSVTSSKAECVLGLLAGAVCTAALWLTGTRSAMVGGIVAVLGLAGWRVFANSRERRLFPIATVAAVVLATALTAAAFGSLSTSARNSLHFRYLFAETALGMMAAEPFLGVGIGRYGLASAHFGSSELLRAYPTSEAHNNFLWVGAELGLTGLILFLWVLGAALLPGWRRLHSGSPDFHFLGVYAGIIAFMITWFSWQPLSVHHVAYTFWSLLGIVAAAPAPRATLAASAHAAALVVVFILLLIVSVPVRANRAMDQIDFGRVQYGFYNTGEDDGRQFTWVGPDVRFYRTSTDRAVMFGLASKLDSTRDGVAIEVRIDGVLVETLTLLDDQWHDLRLDAPASHRKFWRVDLHIAPIGMPEDMEDRYRQVAFSFRE